jgi:threonine dehydrogenase-like Zn-dependent dehydrogenase
MTARNLKKKELSMTSATYKAAIFRGPGCVDLVNLPYPQCGDNDAIIRNLLTGVCGSDVAAYRHGGDAHMIWQDHEFGHESIAEVVAVGKNVVGLDPGDHVFPNLGQALRDMNRMATVGGFSEYVRVPECVVGYSVLKIDNDIPLKAAVLVEPFIIGTRGAQSLAPAPGKSAIVFGAGIIGISAAIMLDWYGCEQVMVVDISEFRLENARRLGLVTCNPSIENLKAKAIAEFGAQQGFLGESCAAGLYLDAIGIGPAVEGFSELAPRDGALAVVGVHHGPTPIDLMKVCYNNWKIGGCGSITAEEAVVDILEMMRSGRYDLASLVTHEFGIESIEDALVMGAKANEAQKVCISFAA